MSSSDNDKLAPGYLVAPPSMGDPNFDRTLVLMVNHDESGSLGFVVNRPSNVSLHALLQELEIAPTIGNRSVLLGGPVGTSTGFVLYQHPENAPLAAGMSVTPTVSLSPSKEVLVAAATGKLPGHFELLLGYAGWGPGQLENELQRGSWLHAAFDSQILFDVAIESRWAETYEQIGVSPLGFMNVPGGAFA